MKTDFDFDKQVIEDLDDLTTFENINPWTRPIGHITWGLVLTTWHLNFLYLQFILPTIGTLLIYFGFCSLRNENIYFKSAWIWSIFRLFLSIFNILIVTTPLNTMDIPKLYTGVVIAPFHIAFLLIFHFALKKVYIKADKTPAGSPLILISLWSLVSSLIALSPLSRSLIIFIPMAILYIFIIRSLLRIGDGLEEVGYVLQNSSVKIGNRPLGYVYFLFILLIVIIASINYNHLKLDSTEYSVPEATYARQRLISMGFPRESLKYLDDYTASVLKEAKCIETYNELLMFDPKDVEHQENYSGDTYTHVTITHEPGKKNIESTTTYIEMPDNLIYIMQYFTWKGGNPIWQDGIQIAGENTSEWQIISSGLFFNKGGTDYVADFPRLSYDRFTQEGMFGTSEYMQIMGALSFPFGSKSQGGYVLYSYELPYKDNVFATYSLLNYIHHSSPFHIPYMRTEDRILSGSYTFSNARAQHYTTYDSLAIRKLNDLSQ